MHNSEQWLKWNPVFNVLSRYEFQSMTHTSDSITIILFDPDKNKKIKIVFDGFVDAYQYVDIRYQAERLNEIEKKYGKEFFNKWTFFKVINSDLRRWLNEESLGIIDYFFTHNSYMHFAFVTSTCVIDVIAGYEPKIEFIQ